MDGGQILRFLVHDRLRAHHAGRRRCADRDLIAVHGVRRIVDVAAGRAAELTVRAENRGHFGVRHPGDHRLLAVVVGGHQPGGADERGGAGGLLGIAGQERTGGVAQLEFRALDVVGGGVLDGGQVLRLLVHDRLLARHHGGDGQADLDVVAVHRVGRAVAIAAGRAAELAVGAKDRRHFGVGQRADHGLLAVVVHRHHPGGADERRGSPGLQDVAGKERAGCVAQLELRALDLVGGCRLDGGQVLRLLIHDRLLARHHGGDCHADLDLVAVDCVWRAVGVAAGRAAELAVRAEDRGHFDVRQRGDHSLLAVVVPCHHPGAAGQADRCLGLVGQHGLALGVRDGERAVSDLVGRRGLDGRQVGGFLVHDRRGAHLHGRGGHADRQLIALGLVRRLVGVAAGRAVDVAFFELCGGLGAGYCLERLAVPGRVGDQDPARAFQRSGGLSGRASGRSIRRHECGGADQDQ